jgi:hypothetical protein
MTSPVLAALANAKAAKQAAEERTLTEATLKHLGISAPQGDRSHLPFWQAWCAKKNIASFPALPAAVAIFVLNHKDIGDLEKVIGGISIVHQERGAADPTLSPIVIAALNQVRPIEPPRSWDTAHKIRFQQLPRDVAVYIRDRENNRDRALRQHMEKVREEFKNADPKQKPTAAARTDRTDAAADRNETAA